MSEKNKQLPKQFKKGHKLIFSSQSLTSREANLFALMMAHMKESDWDQRESPTYSFSAAKLVEWLGINANSVSSQLKPVVKRLVSHKIGITDEDNKDNFKFINLFKAGEYKNGVLILTPNDLLQSEYKLYGKGFALIETSSYLDLKGEYTKRLYEMISRFKDQNMKLHDIPLDKLYAYLGLLDDNGKLKPNKKSYASTHVFIQRCIKKSIAELQSNPKTRKEIQFLETKDGTGLVYHKQGKVIKSIEFKFKWIADITSTNLVAQMDLSEAKKIIPELELRRHKKEVLDLTDLKILAHAYRSLNHVKADEKADLIDIEIINYKPPVVDEIDDIEDFLSKIDELSIL